VIPVFEFATATRVVFGSGSLAEVVPIVRGTGAARVLLVTGKNPDRAEPVQRALAAAHIDAVAFAVPTEPTVELAREGAARAISEGCQAVVAMGGGSAIDAGKAIAALATNRAGDARDYLEVIGTGRALVHPSLPMIAIPTTAGTGSEVTRNAVLLARDARVKVSLRSPFLFPLAAIVDPDLLIGAPASVLIASGLDALAQLIEPFISGRANPLTDAMAREGMRRSVRSLRPAVLDGSDATRREDLALASLMGGLCLANAGLGAVHGFAAPAGGMWGVPHGAVCAAFLAPVMAVNARALATRASDPATRACHARFDELGALLTGDGHASGAAAVTWLEDLARDLDVKGLGHFGMTAADVPTLIDKAKRASSMKGNPIVLTDAELGEIALRALAG
jgi:alcohol dehydrogenase class IV